MRSSGECGRPACPIAYSAGFSPHPKISYAGGAPTGTASEAEYLEIALTGACPAPDVRDRLDAALPDGIDVIEVSDLADAPGGIAALRLEGSQWQVILPGVAADEAASAVQAFLAAESAVVERLTSKGIRQLDARAAVVALELDRRAAQEADAGCVILRMVVRHLTPAVRPDDILAALSAHGGSGAVVTAAGDPAGAGAARHGGRYRGQSHRRCRRNRRARNATALRADGGVRRAGGGGPTPCRPAGLRLKDRKRKHAWRRRAPQRNMTPRLPDRASHRVRTTPARRGRACSGPRAREYDGRLPGCSKPSDTTENQTTTTGRRRWPHRWGNSGPGRGRAGTGRGGPRQQGNRGARPQAVPAWPPCGDQPGGAASRRAGRRLGPG